MTNPIAQKAFKSLECSLSLDKHTSIQPIGLSCGHVICKQCVPLNCDHKIKCLHCDKINKLDLSDCEESISIKCLFETYFKDFLNIIHDRYLETFDKLKKNKMVHEQLVSDRIDCIRGAIDLRLDQIRVELNKYRDDLIKQLDQIQSEIICSEQKYIQSMLDADGYESKFKELSESLKKCEDIPVEKFIDYEKNLFDLKKFVSEPIELDFEINFKSNEIKSELYGTIELTHPHFTTEPYSSILNENQIHDLMNLCNWEDTRKLELIYRGSVDGYGSNVFHEKCDNISNTLTIVKSTKGYIFGGFTSANWYQVGENGHYKIDSKSFIFSLVNRDNLPLKIDVLNAQKAIVCNNSWGPVFGNDLHIASDSNTNTNSQSDLNYSYRSNRIKSDTSTFLAGSNKFQILDIEVFKVF